MPVEMSLNKNIETIFSYFGKILTDFAGEMVTFDHTLLHSGETEP